MRPVTSAHRPSALRPIRPRAPRLPRTALVLALAGVLIATAAGTASALGARPLSAAVPNLALADPTLSADTRFGPHVLVFDPSMPTSEIQAAADAVSAVQVDDEMGTNRWSLLFRPGTYGTATTPLQIKVGYYTEVAGLGAEPGDVVINGKVEVYNRCLGDGGTSNCIALNNFWRIAVQPHDPRERRGPGRLPRLRQLLGGQPGGVDAAGGRERRQPVAHGLLHGGSAVRQRWVHRRLPVELRHQRLAAAVARAQQRGRRLEQRRLEPGVLRGRGRSVRDGLPQPSVHDSRDDPAEP